MLFPFCPAICILLKTLVGGILDCWLKELTHVLRCCNSTLMQYYINQWPPTHILFLKENNCKSTCVLSGQVRFWLGKMSHCKFSYPEPNPTCVLYIDDRKHCVSKGNVFVRSSLITKTHNVQRMRHHANRKHFLKINWQTSFCSFLSIEFIEVTLVNRPVQVSSVQLNKTSSSLPIEPPFARFHSLLLSN